MEEQNKSNETCCCEGGCCTPSPKNSRWRKWVFLAIVLAAGAVLAVKLVSNRNATPAPCCPGSPCCPQPSNVN